ncbi:hypothetical protein [Arthrobacter sp. B1805]|uniref:hypothetical protein n=1 Tax=Arthrobacter sp. B1805 TaxID=2058892 RepID=UPI000CE2E591|nr:hypothetical protein [Arthrobacter sp. B1805]
MEELTFIFAQLKGLMLTEVNAGLAVEDLAEAVKKSVPGSLGAGVSLIDDQGRKRSTGYTDDVVAAADALQYELGQGPCLTAWAAETTVQVDDDSALRRLLSEASTTKNDLRAVALLVIDGATGSSR